MSVLFLPFKSRLRVSTKGQVQACVSFMSPTELLGHPALSSVSSESMTVKPYGPVHL